MVLRSYSLLGLLAQDRAGAEGTVGWVWGNKGSFESSAGWFHGCASRGVLQTLSALISCELVCLEQVHLLSHTQGSCA